MDETIYVVLEGGLVLPISHVTSNFSPSNVVVYDGETYRDDPIELLALSPTAVVANTLTQTYIGSATMVAGGVSDIISHTAPRYKGKQRTMHSFARTISSAAAYTHVVWADHVIGSCSHPPFRIGMTPTSIS